MSIKAEILIVDDQTSDLGSLSDLLEKEGYYVNSFADSQLAIDSAFLESPDLIILNSHMPGMDGFEVCQHLKQDKRTEHIPKIFISALDDSETRTRGFEAGCVDFISKPFQELEVLARVKAQVGLHKMKLHHEKLVEERTAELTKSKAALEQKIKALQESEERFRLVFDNANEGISIAQDKVTKYCNRQITELSGYSEEEVLKMNFLTFIHPDDMEMVNREYQLRLSGEKPKSTYPIRLITKQGQEKDVLVNSTLINWEGQPATLVLLSDISSLRNVESDLKSIKERYELAVSGSDAGIWDWDIVNDAIYFSDQFKKMLGYSDKDWSIVSLQDYRKLVHPEDVESADKKLSEYMSQKKGKFHNVYRMQTKSGQYRWFQVSGRAIRDENGNLVRGSGSLLDIHESKLAEEELKKSERHFRHLMESTPLAIAIFRPDGTLSKVNAAWKKLWGLNEQEAIQVMAEYNIITDKQLEDLGLTPLVKRAFEGESLILPPITYQGSTTTGELGLEEIESQSRTIQMHYHSVKDTNGDLEYLVAINVDLTDLKKVELEAEAQRESIARMDRTSSMGQLTGSIAHELNQPLTGILSNAQAAEMLVENESWTTEDLREIMSAIVSDTKRASSVIRNLREMYREHTSESFPFEINEIANQTIQLLNSELIGNNIHLATNLDPTVPKAVGNVVQIQQILVNLIMNAIQAMKPLEKVDRQLDIATEHEKNKIKVWVKDHGPGIDPDNIDHIFEPFATWRAGGTGMGLAISNSIITAHGGSMWAENLVEGGCKVGFILPVSNEDNNA